MAKKTKSTEELEQRIEQLEEETEHYKIYLKAWQKSRSMINDIENDKNLTKEEKQAINTIFNTMTQALDEVIRS